MVRLWLTVLLGALVQMCCAQASQKFVKVGCFRDSGHDRALPDLIANFRVSNPLIDWSNISKTIQHCARVAQSRGYVYFALQFWGECWAGHNGHVTYDKYGPATTCKKGVGEGFTNYVYRNTGLENECNGYKVLASHDRAMTYENKTAEYKCDKDLTGEWYRFMGGAGNAMANKCVPESRCATLVQGWLKGALPRSGQGIVPGKVCYRFATGLNEDCCKWSQTIRVRNCGRFYVYKLDKPMYGCHFRYCGNGK